MFQLLLRLDPQSAVGCKLLMITAKVAGFCYVDPIQLSCRQLVNPVKAIGQAESDLDALVEAQAETLCLGDLNFCRR